MSPGRSSREHPVSSAAAAPAGLWRTGGERGRERERERERERGREGEREGGRKREGERDILNSATR